MSQRRRSMTEPQAEATPNENLAKFEHTVSEISDRTDAQEDRQTDVQTCSSQYLTKYDNNVQEM